MNFIKNIKSNVFTKASLAFVISTVGFFSLSSCNEEEVETQSQATYAEYLSNLFTVTVDGLDATFNNYSLGATSYLWEVYDEDDTLVASSTEEIFDYTFSDYGSYDVYLTTYDAEGEILEETDEDDDTDGNQGFEISVAVSYTHLTLPTTSRV